MLGLFGATRNRYAYYGDPGSAPLDGHATVYGSPYFVSPSGRITKLDVALPATWSLGRMWIADSRVLYGYPGGTTCAYWVPACGSRIPAYAPHMFVPS